MSQDGDRVFRSRRAVTPEGIRPADVVVRGERIVAVLPLGEGAAPEVVEVPEGAALLPGLVDPHVHVNEPGRTEWEGYRTATRAALAGGITTMVDMPLNCIPVTTSREAFARKREALAGALAVDCGFWGGVVPGNADQLSGMLEDGVLGFKAFMCHSGIDDFPASGAADLRAAMQVLAAEGAPLLLHAELEGDPDPDPSGGDPRAYAGFLASRPPRWEVDAIRLAVELMRETGCRAHVVHLSAADALEVVRAARAEGLPLTTETCPHYLTLTAEEIPDGATPFKCAPPIREDANRQRLWEALVAGDIDFVVSDHSPCTPDLKRLDEGDFEAAWGGISSLQLGLPLVWAEASGRGVGLEQVVTWLATGPAGLAGLAGRKGSLVAGADADLVVFDPEPEVEVRVEDLHFRNKVTPYEGRRARGRVLETWLRGRRAWDGGAFLGEPAGRPLLRDREDP